MWFKAYLSGLRISELPLGFYVPIHITFHPTLQVFNLEPKTNATLCQISNTNPACSFPYHSIDSVKGQKCLTRIIGPYHCFFFFSKNCTPEIKLYLEWIFSLPLYLLLSLFCSSGDFSGFFYFAFQSV